GDAKARAGAVSALSAVASMLGEDDEFVLARLRVAVGDADPRVRVSAVEGVLALLEPYYQAQLIDQSRLGSVFGTIALIAVGPNGLRDTMSWVRLLPTRFRRIALAAPANPSMSRELRTRLLLATEAANLAFSVIDDPDGDVASAAYRV